jgi:tRNA G18 (ribose-2'-O)-methylase SpoU
MPEHFIEILEDPRLAPYRNLKAKNLTRRSGLFIAEGRLVVERLLASSFPVVSVLVSERRRRTIVPQLRSEADVYVIPQRLAEQLVGYNFHAGVLACGRRKQSPGLETVFEKAEGRVTLAACPQIIGPENLGAIIRLCAAFGVDTLLLGQGCADPFSRRVLRVSMGAALKLPIVESRDLASDISSLRSRWGVQLAAAALDQDAEALAGSARPDRFALLFGNESEGLPQHWIDLCQRRITIPMSPGADSLNVAAAAAIFLHYFTRIA